MGKQLLDTLAEIRTRSIIHRGKRGSFRFRFGYRVAVVERMKMHHPEMTGQIREGPGAVCGHEIRSFLSQNTSFTPFQDYS
jgi:hypothetical protein